MPVRTRVLLAVLVLSGAVSGCAPRRPAALLAGPDCERPLKHERLHAVLWMQQSGEYAASAEQAYRTAAANLTIALRHPAQWTDAVPPAAPQQRRRAAVIVDVDETILDNTPEEVALMAADKRKYEDAIWKAWERKNAEPIPGALAFLQDAARRNVDVFYVTNRSAENKSVLHANLARLGFPLPLGDESILTPADCSTGDTSTDKECRRRDIARGHRVLLLVGDDLSDFLRVSGMTVEQRLAAVRSNAARWGQSWIVLPNPSYGSWERAYYDSQHDEGDVILQKKCRQLRAPR
jgi:5'-nucleotidase (lipoprotein e(P4) family)